MRGRGLPWSEIEAEWRERRQKGKVNLSRLSRDFDCTPALIRARIKRYAWESPNERAIMERTRALPGQAVIGYKGDPETVGKILDGLEAGNNYATSCALAGVNYTTFKKWREADTEFDAMINESLARSAQKNLNRIDNLADRDWKAAEKLLSVNPLTKEDFSQNKHVGGGTINVQINIPRPGDMEQNYGDTAIEITESEEVQ